MTDSKIPQDWQKLLADFDRRTNQAKAMGGEEKLAKRKTTGLPNAREIIDTFTDENSFEEIGSLVGSKSYNGETTLPCDGIIGGIAKIDNKPIVIAVEDFTVKGGSIGHGSNAKRVRLATLAKEQSLPYLLLLDGAGVRMENPTQRHPYSPTDLQVLTGITSPKIAVIIGSSAGHSAISALMMDFIIMLENAAMFAAGPPLVQAAMGEVISKEDLGGADIHTTISGVAHNKATNTEDAAKQVKRYLNFALKNQVTDSNIQEQDQYELMNLIPANLQTPYSIKPVIACITDQGTFFEIQPDFGKAMVTGFARIKGNSIAVIANQPAILAGAIDANAANKAADFIKLACKLNIALLFLADTPGILSGSKAERDGTLKAAANMYQAQADYVGTKMHVTLRKCYGFASCMMAMNPFDHQAISIALPGVSLGGIPTAGGANAAKMTDKEKLTLQQQQSESAYTVADALAYDEIVNPQNLRNCLITTLEFQQSK